MAEPPVIALRDVAVGFGGPPLFAGIGLALARGDKVCLVGRNGSGKSTLLKLVAGLVEPDAGDRFVQPGLRLAYLAQDPPTRPGQTAAAFVAEQTPAVPDHAIAAALDQVGLDGARLMDTLSGGEARRAAFARVLAGEPDVVLLDEPTNHLDLPGIEALERWLGAYPGAVVVVSHDRTFLANITRRVLWLDRGNLRASDKGFAHFEEWSEAVLTEEERLAQRLDTKLAAETRWLQRGVTARRKRNQGRLGRLVTLRAERAALIGGPRNATITLKEGEVRSRMVIEAEGLAFARAGRALLSGFSTRILRGDRIGVIGPNGAGKTTLLRLLTGDLTPDAGRVRLAKNLARAYFDQTRAALEPAKSLWETLVPEGGDTVVVGGEPRHVASYLKDFLFDPKQARSPVSTLSGGERNRLLLAKILAQPADLLILDEPTNDLDMETLDLLEDVLGDYTGTLLVVSHDRDFLDRVATSVIALEGDGTAQEYAGGYSDYRRQRRTAPARRPAARPAASRSAAATAPEARSAPARLGYKDQRELGLLPERIAGLEAEIASLQAALSQAGAYARDSAGFARNAARLDVAKAELAAAEERWLDLEMRREALADDR